VVLTAVEKVILLQEVDIFEHTTTEDLAYIAAITEECDFARGNIIYREGEISDSMYLVIEGTVVLRRGEKDVLTAKKKDVFGTWSLFDDEPRVVTAVSADESTLLKIDKDDFFELLADHVQITQGILKAIVKKLRSLADRVGMGSAAGSSTKIGE
jgi:CRP/FNR family cyclic AMP-dependent transcriptional regulator